MLVVDLGDLVDIVAVGALVSRCLTLSGMTTLCEAELGSGIVVPLFKQDLTTDRNHLTECSW